MKSFDQIYTESAKTATLTLGFNGTSGKVLVEKAQNGAESIVLDASTSTASLGGDKAGDGNIQLWNASGKNTVSVTSSVKVDIKKFARFLYSYQVHPTNVICCLVENRALVLHVLLDDLYMTYYLPVLLV